MEVQAKSITQKTYVLFVGGIHTVNSENMKLVRKVYDDCAEKFTYYCYDSNDKKTPTVETIDSYIDKAYKKATKNDICIFYYAGHGTAVSGKGIGLTLGKSKWYLYKNLASKLNCVKCKKMMVVLDCCKSGTALKDNMAGFKTEKMIVYTSTAPEENGFFLNKKYSRFTKHFTYGLGAKDGFVYADANLDGNVTAKELEQYLQISINNDLIGSEFNEAAQNIQFYAKDKNYSVYKYDIEKARLIIPSTLTLYPKETSGLSALITGKSKTISWSSSNKAVAVVDSKGNVTAKNAGSCTITAKANGKTAKCSVKVIKKSIQLDYSDITIRIGNNQKLNVSVVGKSDTVTWKSSNTKIATVSSSGNVKAVKVGTCTISAKANGITAKCKVTVTNPTISLGLSSYTMEVGDTASISVTKTGTDSLVEWSSSNSLIATVNTYSGVINAKKTGTCVITASVDGVSASCNITVEAKSEPGITMVSCGDDFTGILKSDGSLWMTGYNGIGQLGNGDTYSKRIPEQIMTNVKSVSCGALHTAILKKDGSLWMTGRNVDGQFGNGTYTSKYTPVKVMTGVKAVSCGGEHTAIIKTDNSLWMVGANYRGQLGNGTTENKCVPEQIMSDVKMVSCGRVHTAILRMDGSLWMVGDNQSGALGDGTTENKYVPEQIMTDVKAVSCGMLYTAILKIDGTLWMTGYNWNGQLGDGTRSNTSIPKKIMTDVKTVSCGGQHTAIIKTDGTLWMTGNNESGQLGDGTVYMRTTPIEIMTDVDEVSCGDRHTAIITKDRSLWMTGENLYGQFGDGSNNTKVTPVKVFG